MFYDNDVRPVICNGCNFTHTWKALAKPHQWLATGRWIYPGPPVSPTNKTDRHDIAEILLKVALNTIKTNQLIIKWGGLGYKTSLTPPIEMPVPRQESERSWICIYEGYIFYLFLRYLTLDVLMVWYLTLDVLMVWYLLFFILLASSAFQNTTESLLYFIQILK